MNLGLSLLGLGNSGTGGGASEPEGSIIAGAGFFTVSGQEAILTQTHTALDAAQGSYTLSGQDATLTYSGGGAAFSPDDISGLELWLKGDGTIADTSGLVDQWNDESGNARHVTASGTDRPSTGTRTINSVNVMDFTGSGQRRLEGSDGLGFTGSPNITIFVVSEVDSSASSQHALVHFGATASGGGTVISVNDGDRSYRFNNGFRGFTNASTSTPTITLWEHAASDTYADVALWANGVAQTQDGVSGGTNTLSLADERTLIGLRTGGSGSTNYTSPLVGAIAEVLVYSAVLSTSEKNDVGQYLDDRWGITWTDIT